MGREPGPHLLAGGIDVRRFHVRVPIVRGRRPWPRSIGSTTGSQRIDGIVRDAVVLWENPGECTGAAADLAATVYAVEIVADVADTSPWFLAGWTPRRSRRPGSSARNASPEVRR